MLVKAGELLFVLNAWMLRRKNVSYALVMPKPAKIPLLFVSERFA